MDLSNQQPDSGRGWPGAKPAAWLAVVLLLAGMLSARASILDTTRWSDRDGGDPPRVHLHLFWSADSPRSQEALTFLRSLDDELGWLVLHEYDVTGNPFELDRYRKMAAALDQEMNALPGFFLCRQMVTGFTDAASSGTALRGLVARCREVAQETAPDPPPKQLPKRIPAPADPGAPAAVAKPSAATDGPAKSLPLPVYTVLIATHDALTLCALPAVALLCAGLLAAGRRPQMAAAAGGFLALYAAGTLALSGGWIGGDQLDTARGWAPVIAGLPGLLAALLAALGWWRIHRGWPAPGTALPVGALAAMTALAGVAYCGGALPAGFAETVLARGGSPIVAALYALLYSATHLLPAVGVALLVIALLGSGHTARIQFQRLLGALALCALSLFVLLPR